MDARSDDSDESHNKFKEFEPFPTLLAMYKDVTNESKQKLMRPMNVTPEMVMKNDQAMVDYLLNT